MDATIERDHYRDPDTIPIVQFGMMRIGHYEESEYVASLEKAFVTMSADFITLDSSTRGQTFLAAGVAWAIEQGLLFNDHAADDGQCETFSFRLTAAGRERLGMA